MCYTQFKVWEAYKWTFESGKVDIRDEKVDIGDRKVDIRVKKVDIENINSRKQRSKVYESTGKANQLCDGADTEQ